MVNNKQQIVSLISGNKQAFSRFGANKIGLFGSFVRGDQTENSDVDLVIISEKNKIFPQEKQFEKRLNRKIQILFFNSIKEIKNTDLTNNIINGYILNGRIRL